MEKLGEWPGRLKTLSHLQSNRIDQSIRRKVYPLEDKKTEQFESANLSLGCKEVAYVLMFHVNAAPNDCWGAGILIYLVAKGASQHSSAQAHLSSLLSPSCPLVAPQ